MCLAAFGNVAKKTKRSPREASCFGIKTDTPHLPFFPMQVQAPRVLKGGVKAPKCCCGKRLYCKDHDKWMPLMQLTDLRKMTVQEGKQNPKAFVQPTRVGDTEMPKNSPLASCLPAWDTSRLRTAALEKGLLAKRARSFPRRPSSLSGISLQQGIMPH